ncbi:Multicopper oxidase with three cupredoxin domains (includes cell division protein FtsP and spore coat protein CotA) [Tardiphaga sp. OK246]|uniref:multicopper oxidase family protein n=1 Tax=Tardiphaga sp. OK246 TaxID=1855307 RepID=UPI000B6513F7|nr:multicopper oxidase domain-containing protein [Tardiphaga sp. OK246]SNT15913.1 Multicopper oxidase with three cupredoxin domains (includes cell division protein FtsP and spore coat protein CotA) [Tardiphaga sp. OK246]
MTNRFLPLTRRTLLAGAGSALIAPILSRVSLAQAVAALELQAKADPFPVKPGASTEAWTLHSPQRGPLRFNRGDEITVQLANQLPIPIVLNCRGINGSSGIGPLLDRKPVAAGAKDAFKLQMRSAGTSYLDMRLLGDGQALPSQVRSLVVQESDPVEVDRDEVLLIEDFRLRPDGSLLAPASDPKDAAALFLINRKSTLELSARVNERFRLRLINGCQRNVVALKFDDHEVRVLAIDGQPSEPFPARNNQVGLAPGTRVDVFLDAVRPAGSTSAILLHDGKTARPIGQIQMSNDPPLRATPLPAAAPLPSNGLPAQLDLKGALRVDMALSAVSPEWVKPVDLSASTPPAFRTKPGRTIVLALTNRATSPMVFQIHGHHVRLLDRLDDGWKPFWLDTLALDAGQTQRIAFAANNVGRWLMEAFVADWAAPRQVRWYGVD